MNIEPSNEQLNIINEVFINKNVKVNAVSGSGKSTCVLSMAKFLDKKILQITYNRSLCIEVRKKAIMAGLPNLVVHTYHSLAVKHYDSLAYMDNGLENIVKNNTPIKYPEWYDIIVIDEAQDMTVELYQIIRKYIRDANINPTIIIMGDQYQSVYEFKGANRRFLTKCDKIWNKCFVEKQLRTSYRVTRQIAAFVNDVMLGQDRITAIKDGPPIDYIPCTAFNAINKIHNSVIENTCLPGDVFILLASIKSTNQRAPFKQLANLFTHNGWPVYVPDNDESVMNDEIIQNKVVFSTFHQSKGRERPVVVIMNFDNSYFIYNAKDLDPFECPATLYVAATRASRKLIIHDGSYMHGRLPFLKRYDLGRLNYINLIGVLSTKSTFIQPNQNKVYSATSLIKFLRPAIMAKIIHLLNELFIVVRPAGININLISIYNKEDVSDINGIVIPLIYEYLTRKTSSILEYIKTAEIPDDYINKFILPENPQTPSEFIRISLLYHAIQSGFIFKLSQITNTNWLTREEINECLKNMDIVNPVSYECYVKKKYISPTYGVIEVDGRIDIKDTNYIYEIKCVNVLSIEHKLQLLVYSIICGENKYRLLNIKNGECLEMLTSWPTIIEIFELIIQSNLTSCDILEDDSFIQHIQLKNLEMDIYNI
jgi:hypothetical protein